ncbi:soluble quino protein glucose dehydrogenase [Durotheca rogersii]|uniref:soluble quino protein glucose dehydrogenase n=1 Tax=Durotheca rogersii TaxID=419775 RepID=UPI00221ED671|nr:soluble quino protein glucose dehydrogenase [Durotheca rogersii]KAI5860915.1 soluble quino protein glucose dehydrogenase [Durotheca rogersii]
MVAFRILGPLGLLASATAAQNCPFIEPSAPLKLSSGYTARVLLNGLGYPRHLAVDAAGNLLVVEANRAGVRRVVLSETDGEVCVASSGPLIPDPSLNHGIAISQDGKTLFVSSPSDVYAYPYDAAAGTVGEGRSIIGGMSSGGHITRTLLAPLTAPDTLLISRGSDGNIDNSTVDAASGKSIIKSFYISDLLASESPKDFNTEGEVFGWGLRNTVGVDEDLTTGNIWSVENSADNIHRNGVDVHLENPAEELNFHGAVSDEASPLKGANYGYPVCFSAWQTTGIPQGSEITRGSQFGGVDTTPFVEVTGSEDLGEIDNFCRSEREGPRIAFPSHNAPLDIKVKADGSAAFIAFHGSWNRSPPDGYRVGRINFTGGQPAVDVASSDEAVEYILQNEDNNLCPGACFRPTGLAFDDGGRLYMTSDSTGELYVITGA